MVWKVSLFGFWELTRYCAFYNIFVLRFSENFCLSSPVNIDKFFISR